MTSPHPVETTMAANGTTLAAKILSSKETAERLGLSLRTLERLAKAGEAPPKVRLSPNRVGFSEAEVAAWIARRTQGRSA